jgi:hypothetical protein
VDICARVEPVVDFGIVVFVREDLFGAVVEAGEESTVVGKLGGGYGETCARCQRGEFFRRDDGVFSGAGQSSLHLLILRYRADLLVGS